MPQKNYHGHHEQSWRPQVVRLCAVHALASQPKDVGYTCGKLIVCDDGAWFEVESSGEFWIIEDMGGEVGLRADYAQNPVAVWGEDNPRDIWDYIAEFLGVSNESVPA